MSRYAFVAALTVTVLLGGCSKDEPTKIPLGTSATFSGNAYVTPHAVWVGAPGDLASVTVRHADGSDEPPPPGTPYYVPTTVSNTTGSAHELLRAVDGDGDEVAPLDYPHWKSGIDPCEPFFREGSTPSEIEEECVVFVLPEDVELDYLVTAGRTGAERTAWAVPRKESPPPSPTPSPSPTVRTDDEACGGVPFKASAVRAYNPNAPAYAGAGIHPVRLFKPGVFDAGDVGPHLPNEWTSNEADRIQLVVCEHRDPSFRDRKIDTCTYVGGYRPSTDAEVRTARYVYRVFEARTGRLVTTFTLNGTTTAAELCPDETYAPASTYWQRVTSKALESRLKPLVAGNAPTR